MSVETKFYVSLPDEHWCSITGSQEIVIEAYESRIGSSNILRILEPRDFASAFVGDKSVHMPGMGAVFELQGRSRRI